MTKISTRICDQCHSKHLRCDRLSPKCSRCLKSDLQCTWDRFRALPRSANFEVKNYFIEKSANHKYRNFSKKSCIKTFRSDSSQDSNIWSKNLNQSLVFINTPLNVSNVYSVSKQWKNIFGFWNQSTIKRYTFKIFLSSCDISIKNFNNQDFKIIDYVMTPKRTPSKKKDFSQLQPTFLKQDIVALSSQAIKAYFYYFNPFFPLFTFSSFYQRPRSNFLKYVIIGIGLRFLPRSDLRDRLIVSVESKILWFKKLSNLTFNLDTLQALLCIFSGLVWSNVEDMNYSLFRISIAIMYSIGLHRNKSCPKSAISLESSLAFYVINYISTAFFSDGVANFSLQGISIPKKSFKTHLLISSHVSKINNVHQPLDYTQLELYYLTIAEKLHISSTILNKVSEAFIDKEEKLNLVIKAEKYMVNLLDFGLKKLKSLKYNNLNVLKDELLDFKIEFRNPSFFELVHSLRVRLCFDILRLFDLFFKTKITVNGDSKLLALYKRAFNYSIFVIKGLVAINSEAPFVFYRPTMTLVSTRIVIQTSRYCNHKSVKNLVDLSLSLLHNQSKLEMYSYSAAIQKELLEALIKKLLKH